MPNPGMIGAFRGDVREGVRRGRGRYRGSVAPGTLRIVDDRPPRPREPVVHATWLCPNALCRQWTRPSMSADGASCDNCHEPRPAHLTARVEEARRLGVVAMPDHEAEPRAGRKPVRHPRCKAAA